VEHTAQPVSNLIPPVTLATIKRDIAISVFRPEHLHHRMEEGKNFVWTPSDGWTAPPSPLAPTKGGSIKSGFNAHGDEADGRVERKTRELVISCLSPRFFTLLVLAGNASTALLVVESLNH